MLAGQAHAVEDLEIVVREELRACHEALEQITAAAASTMDAVAPTHAPSAGAVRAERALLQKLAEQGEAIKKLDGLVRGFTLPVCAPRQQQQIASSGPSGGQRGAQIGVGSRARETSASAASALPSSSDRVALEGRVETLEGDMAEVRQQSIMLSAAMRQVRDHAADALDDRVAAAVSEVHRRLAGSLAAVRGRVQGMRAVVRGGRSLETAAAAAESSCSDGAWSDGG